MDKSETLVYTENFAFNAGDFKSLAINKHHHTIIRLPPSVSIITSFATGQSQSLRHQLNLLGQLKDVGLFTEEAYDNFVTELRKVWKNYFRDFPTADEEALDSTIILKQRRNKND